MANNEEFMSFLIQQFGGKEAAQQEFAKQKLISAISGGSTVGFIIDKATQEGWIETLRAVKFSDLLGSSKGHHGPSGGSRITKAQKEEMKQKILSFLEKNPWVSKGAVAEAIGFDAVKVGAQLRVLREEKLVKVHGKKINTTYALFGEKTKP